MNARLVLRPPDQVSGAIKASLLFYFLLYSLYTFKGKMLTSFWEKEGEKFLSAPGISLQGARRWWCISVIVQTQVWENVVFMFRLFINLRNVFHSSPLRSDVCIFVSVTFSLFCLFMNPLGGQSLWSHLSLSPSLVLRPATCLRRWRGLALGWLLLLGEQYFATS